MKILKERESNDIFETYQVTYECDNIEELLQFIRDNINEGIKIHATMLLDIPYIIEYTSTNVNVDIDIYSKYEYCI